MAGTGRPDTWFRNRTATNFGSWPAYLALVGPKIVVPLAQRRYSRWFAALVPDIHRVLFGSREPPSRAFMHALRIVMVRLFGRAQGLALPPLRVPVTVLLVPISNSGWDLRELARVSLVSSHGVVPGRALRFGLTMTADCLPGVLARLIYPFAPVRRASEVPYVKAESSLGAWRRPVRCRTGSGVLSAAPSSIHYPVASTRTVAKPVQSGGLE